MTDSTLVYRGVKYESTPHAHPRVEPVEHIYRGVHYADPLRHEPAPVNEFVELHYRGTVYHQRRVEARRQVEHL